MFRIKEEKTLKRTESGLVKSLLSRPEKPEETFQEIKQCQKARRTRDE